MLEPHLQPFPACSVLIKKTVFGLSLEHLSASLRYQNQAILGNSDLQKLFLPLSTPGHISVTLFALVSVIFLPAGLKCCCMTPHCL